MSERAPYYDVILIGSGPAFLASGMTLIKAGARTLLIEEKTGAEHLPFIDGYMLTPILRQLDFYPHELDELKHLDPSLQVVLPRQRFDLYTKDRDFYLELEREFPEAAQSILNRFVDLVDSATAYSQIVRELDPLPPASFQEKHQLKKALRNLTAPNITNKFSHEESHSDFYKLMLDALSLMFSHNMPAKKPLDGYGARLLYQARFGSYRRKPILGQLHDKVGKKGGEFLRHGEVQSIQFRRKKVHGIEVTGGTHPFLRCGSLLSATTLDRLAELLPENSTPRALKKMIADNKPVYRRYATPITMLRDGLPVGLQNRTLYVADPTSPLEGMNLLLLEREDSYEEQTTIWVRFNLPSALEPNEIDMKRLLEQLEKVIPFLPENLVTTTSELVDRTVVLGPVYPMPNESYLQTNGVPMRTRVVIYSWPGDRFCQDWGMKVSGFQEFMLPILSVANIKASSCANHPC